MKRVYQKKAVQKVLEKYEICNYFTDLDLPFAIHYYEAGEAISTPDESETLFQMIVEGSIWIYSIQDDGTKYSMVQSSGFTIIGDLELSVPRKQLMFTEAVTDVTSIVLKVSTCREQLLQDVKFLNLLVREMAGKIYAFSQNESKVTSVEDRVWNHMNYHCEKGILCGLEKTAVRLHCSVRQLQRILNKMENEGIVSRLGKGRYQLNTRKQE